MITNLKRLSDALDRAVEQQDAIRNKEQKLQVDAIVSYVKANKTRINKQIANFGSALITVNNKQYRVKNT